MCYKGIGANDDRSWCFVGFEEGESFAGRKEIEEFVGKKFGVSIV
jgi:hypothetical protein